MIVKREEFIKKFLRWQEKKLRDSLPEEDFEMSMMKQALTSLTKHEKEYWDLTFP